jgi:hypothetical protein
VVFEVIEEKGIDFCFALLQFDKYFLKLIKGLTDAVLEFMKVLTIRNRMIFISKAQMFI